jgi:hypothetical protein
VKLGGRDLIATADYGDIDTHVRLHDMERLMQSDRTSAGGVMVANIVSSPFNQNLYWDQEKSQLVGIQNMSAGRGWRLEFIDLKAAVAAGEARIHGAVVDVNVYGAHDELEGWSRLPNGQEIFITSSHVHNITIGKSRKITPRTSQVGELSVDR